MSDTRSELQLSLRQREHLPRCDNPRLQARSKSRLRPELLPAAVIPSRPRASARSCSRALPPASSSRSKAHLLDPAPTSRRSFPTLVFFNSPPEPPPCTYPRSFPGLIHLDFVHSLRLQEIRVSILSRPTSACRAKPTNGANANDVVASTSVRRPFAPTFGIVHSKQSQGQEEEERSGRVVASRVVARTVDE